MQVNALTDFRPHGVARQRFAPRPAFSNLSHVNGDVGRVSHQLAIGTTGAPSRLTDLTNPSAASAGSASIAAPVAFASRLWVAQTHDLFMSSSIHRKA